MNNLTLKEGLAKYKFTWKRSKEVVKTRPTVVESILNDLFHVFRLETCHNVRQVKILVMLWSSWLCWWLWLLWYSFHDLGPSQALDIVLLAMTEHMHENQIVVGCTAISSIAFLVVCNVRVKFITWAFAFQYFRSRDRPVSTMLQVSTMLYVGISRFSNWETKSKYVISKAKRKILTTLLNGMLQHRFRKLLTYCHYHF